MQFNGYGHDKANSAWGYVTGFASDDEARAFADTLVGEGNIEARTQPYSSMVMTSDHSLIVANALRLAFDSVTSSAAA